MLADHNDRVSFDKIREVIDLPDLLENQKTSYRDFLQRNAPPDERKNTGLQAILKEVFPITDLAKVSSLEFISYSLGHPKYDILECQLRGFSYVVPLKITFQLCHHNTKIQSEVYMGEIPLMTDQGTFIINGSERVIVSQLHRSSGVMFKEEKHSNGRQLLKAVIIPYHGAWIEFEFDIKDLIYVRLDRKKKMFATILLRALGWETDEEIIRLFTKKTETIPVNNSLAGRILVPPVIDQETGETLYESCTKLTETDFEVLQQAGIQSIEVLTAEEAEAIRFLRNTIEKDRQSTSYTKGNITDKALVEISRKIQPGDPPTPEDAKSQLQKLFFDTNSYDLTRGGRNKLNQKFNHLAIYYGKPQRPKEKTTELPADTILRKEDIVSTIQYLLDIYDVRDRAAQLDDPHHLGNRRVRTVGKLLMDQVQIGLLRVTRSIRNKMTAKQGRDWEVEGITPFDLINPKPLSSVLRDFFGSDELSQLLQQTNPLDEITHKRRLSALGKSGLNPRFTTFEARTIHPTHYSRICPLETPHGESVGLITSPALFTRTNDYGFLEAPYHQVQNGKVTNQIRYLTASEEDQYVIAQADNSVGADGNLLPDDKNNTLMARQGDKPVRVRPNAVDYVDASPKQIVGLSPSLIPFLEHNDAYRSVIGSNSQRQAVPLTQPESPYVGTGMEGNVARDSRTVVTARNSGVVERVSASEIIVKTKDITGVETGEQSMSEIGYDTYKLYNFKRSNNNTCIHQKPLVTVGQRIEKRQVIADGPATQRGELALGRNVLVAFMSWEGLNFRDAAVISERLVQEDVLTSIHIDAFEVKARETTQGSEEITRDIPVPDDEEEGKSVPIPEELVCQLDDEGVIRVGTQITPEMILVGKITPQESDLHPSEKLLAAILGEKVGEFKNTSAYAKPGVEGTVINVNVFSRKENNKELRENAKIKEAEQECSRKCQLINQRKTEEVAEILRGRTLASNLHDGYQLIAKAGETLTDELLARTDLLDRIFVDDQQAMGQVQRIRQLAQVRVNAHIMRRNDQIEKIQTGDELKPGVIKFVKVNVATQRKISVGDLIADRHGNKSVVAKILPVEDMPHLADGTPIDMVLNPLSVLARMNVGLIMETNLGWAAEKLGSPVASPIFTGATEQDIQDYLDIAGLPRNGKTTLYDGRTGETFHQKVTVGYTYMMKLNRLVDDIVHARSTGPYSLVTQQPLSGRVQFGGQRLGEMEVWALEAYGAAYTLQEMLTVKSDDVYGRSKMYESIVKGQNAQPPGTPESFITLVKELQALGLNVSISQRKESEEPSHC